MHRHLVLVPQSTSSSAERALLARIGSVSIARLTSAVEAAHGALLHAQQRVDEVAVYGARHAECVISSDGGRRTVVSARCGSEGTPAFECTCRKKGCQHVVAFVLAAHAATEAPEAGRDARAPARPTSIPAPPAKREPLRQWAAMFGIEDLTRTIPPGFWARAAALAPDLSGSHLAWRYSGSSLVDLAMLTAGNLRPLRDAARAYLHERAITRRGHREATRARRWPRATDERLAAHVETLIAKRAGLLDAGVMPREDEVRGESKTAIRPYPTAITLTTHSTASWQTAPCLVEVGLALGGEVTIAIPPAAPVEQTLTFEGIDAALELLTSPSSAADARTLADELTMLPWERLIKELRTGLADEDEPAAALASEVALGWRLSLRSYGEVALVPVRCRPKARGGWTTKELQPADWDAVERRYEHPGDDAAFTACRAERTLSQLSSRDAARSAPLTLALPALVGHPRLFLREGREHHVTLRRARIALATRDLKRGGFQVGFDVDGRFFTATELTQAASRVRLDRAVLLFDLEATTGTATLCALPATIARALAVARDHCDALPAEAARAFVGVALDARQRVPIAVSEGLRGPSEAADDRLRLRLDAAADALTVSVVVVPADELAAEVPGEGPATLYLARDGALVAVARDLAAEREAAGALWRRLGLGGDELATKVPLGERAFDLIRSLSELEGVAVEWSTERKLTVSRPIELDQLKLEARAGKGRAWFTLSGEAAVDGGGTVSLAELLRAIRERQRYVRVDEGRWAEIDDALARRMSALAKREGAIPALMAPIVADLEDAGATLGGALELRASLERLRAARGLVVARPGGLEAELRPYQLEGFQWLARLSAWAPGACLADDMGLGKTVQALALLLHRAQEGPALVVAPTSLGFNWAREAARFAPGLRVVAARTGAELLEVGALGAGDVLVTSYGLVARHVEQLAAVRWGTLVIDEAQSVKNASTQRARALRELEAGFCLTLTGTPVENRASEIWSLFRLVAPGLLGSEAAFREEFAGPLERGDAVARAGLAALIAPFVLRRLKRDVAQDLPPRTEVGLEVVLGRRERERYEEIRVATLRLLDGVDETPGPQQRFKALQALTRLRQLACHPGLLDPKWDGGSRKLDALEELVRRLRDEGHRALVFSQFTSFLGKARERLDAIGVSSRYLDGQTPAAERQRLVDAFQAGEGDVFLLSLKAGGTGLNLTAANYVIHLDPWWNPAVEDQATDRAHRIGQDQPVTVYRLIAKDTVEEGIVRLHGEKRELAEALLSGAGSSAALSYEEMVALIGGLAPSGAPVADDDDEDDDDKGRVIDLTAARAKRAAASKARPPRAPSPAEAAAAPGHETERRAMQLAQRLSAALDAAVARGELKSSSASTYLRTARRFFAFAAQRGLDGHAPETLAAYLDTLADGTVAAGRTEPVMARAAFKWLTAPAER